MSVKSISLLLLAFFVFSFSFRSDLSFDQDLGRHLKLGEIIVQGGQIPEINLFSYTHPDYPFINHHWLFEVLVYLGQQALGIEPLLWLKLLILIGSPILVLATLKKEQFYLGLPLAFIFFHLLRERVELRPEIFSLLFTSLTYFILEKFSFPHRIREGKLIWFLPIIQFLWINIHIYFPVGLVLQGIFLVHLWLLRQHSQLKKLLIVIGLSLLASLVNPHFVQGLFYPLTVLNNYGYSIVENQTIFTLESLGFSDRNFFFFKLSVSVTVIDLIILWLSHMESGKAKVKGALLILSGLGLSLLNVRSFPYLVLLSLPAVLSATSWLKPNRFLNILLIICALFLLAESYFYLSGDYYRQTDSDREVGISLKAHAQKALDFTLSHNLPQPILNNFDIGSYIIYRGYPKLKVFVDGRPEAYPVNFFQDIYIPIQSDIAKFEDLDQKLNFQTIIFSHTDQTPWAKTFLAQVVKHRNWKIVYLDDFMIILVKNRVSQDLSLTTIDLSQLDYLSYRFPNPVSYLRLAIFLNNSGYPELAQKFVKSPRSELRHLENGNIWW